MIALVAIGRMENAYAREWVGHHLGLGFDHIYIYDNNHDGEERFEDVLGDYVEQGSVSIIDCRNREKAQRLAYNDAYRRVAKGYEWVAFFDFDEFLVLPCGEPQGTVTGEPSGTVMEPQGTVTGPHGSVTDGTAAGAAGTVAGFLAKIPAHCDAVMIPWLMMTDNGMVYNDGRPCMERFTESTTNGGGQGKCIVRTGIAGLRFTKSVHVPYEPTLRCCTPKGEPTVQKRHQPQDTSVAYLKHFSTKTIEEWMTNKWQKGAAGITYDTFCEKYRDYFFTINERTSEKEAFIENFLKTDK